MNEKNQSGMALPLVLIISAFLVFLGSVMLNQEVGETVFRVNNEDKTQAYYHARAGAEAVYDVFLNDKANALLLLQNNKYTATPTAFADGEISIEVTDNRHVQESGHNKNEILIKSTGTKGNATEVVTLDLIFTAAATGYNVFSYPIYTNDTFDLGSGEYKLDLYGDGKIATSLPDSDGCIIDADGMSFDDVDFGVDGSMYTTPVFPVGTAIDSITLNNDSDLMIIEKDPVTGLTRVTVDNDGIDSGWIAGPIYLPTFTSTKGKTEVYVPINESIQIVTDTWNSNTEMEIISIDSDGNIWEDDYPTLDDGSLDFEALQSYTDEDDIDGVFELYATTTMYFGTKASVIANTPNAFFAILADGANFTSIAGTEFNGYIYGPDAHVLLQAAKGVFSGAVIADTFNMSNNNADPPGIGYTFYPFFATDIPSGFLDSANYGIAIQSWK